jgi:hypothetical protein
MSSQLTVPDVALLALGSNERVDFAPQRWLVDALMCQGLDGRICLGLRDLHTLLGSGRHHLVVIDAALTREGDGFKLAGELHESFQVGVLLRVDPLWVNRVRVRLTHSADLCLPISARPFEVIEALNELYRRVKMAASMASFPF